MPPGYLLLELSKLIVPQLGTSLSEERPAFDSLKSRLVFCPSEPVSVEVHISSWGRTGTLSSGVFPEPLGEEFSQSHLLQGHICKVSL